MFIQTYSILNFLIDLDMVICFYMIKIKKILVFFLVLLFFLYPIPYTLTPASANHLIGGDECDPNDPGDHCVNGYSCQPSTAIPTKSLCKPSSATDVFGKIEPPEALKPFVFKDPTGTGGISQFLSNFVVLIYVAATIVLVFMLLWGAWDWMSSEGDKEKLSSAQKKIINAFIGILLFAVAFAVIRILGAFTGFTFFTG